MAPHFSGPMHTGGGPLLPVVGSTPIVVPAVVPVPSSAVDAPSVVSALLVVPCSVPFSVSPRSSPVVVMGPALVVPAVPELEPSSRLGGGGGAPTHAAVVQAKSAMMVLRMALVLVDHCGHMQSRLCPVMPVSMQIMPMGQSGVVVQST